MLKLYYAYNILKDSPKSHFCAHHNLYYCHTANYSSLYNTLLVLHPISREKQTFPKITESFSCNIECDVPFIKVPVDMKAMQCRKLISVFGSHYFYNHECFKIFVFLWPFLITNLFFTVLTNPCPVSSIVCEQGNQNEMPIQLLTFPYQSMFSYHDLNPHELTTNCAHSPLNHYSHPAPSKS